MGQETDADNLCEVTDNQQPPRLPYTYTTLFVGWVLGTLIISSHFFSSPSDLYVLLLFFLPHYFFIVCLSIRVQLLIVKGLHEYFLSKKKNIDCIFIAGIFLALIHAFWYLSYWGVIPILKFFSWEVGSLSGTFAADILIIAFLSFCIGILLFILLKYHEAMVLYALLILLPGYKSIWILMQNMNTNSDNTAIWPFLSFPLSLVMINFSLGLILVVINTFQLSTKRKQLMSLLKNQ